MIKKKAYAKLNLNLHILPQKSNRGYYAVRFVNTQLALHDELLFEPIQHKIEVVCDHEEMPKEKDNLIYKAALLLQKMDPQKRGIRITVKKNIPIRAGLGGGSSDAAVTINTLSELWDINITPKQRTYMADILGKDVHYSLLGGLAEIGGNGDKVIPLSLNTFKFWLTLIVPKETKPSTAWMYSQIDEAKIGQHIDFLPKIKEAMELGNKENFLNYIFNDFEDDALKHFPVISTMKQDLKDNGASATLLCGSGLSMVGLFSNKSEASRIQKLLRSKYKDVIITQLL
jgi:4-diphosphocytidyl-2-C-methyl-D-erythritol kinase